MAKPHLKTAATNIAADAVKGVLGQLTEKKNQEGSGGILVLSHRTGNDHRVNVSFPPHLKNVRLVKGANQSGEEEVCAEL